MLSPNATTNPIQASASRGHKRVHWRRPGGKKRPGVLDATTGALVHCLEQRRGIAWFRICRHAIVAGYSMQKASERVRALRRDGAESLLAMSVALLYLADIRTGFLGKPSPDGGKWSRYSLTDLAQLAFGSQAEADVRRARRALDVMIHLGWAFPTKQVKRHAVGADGASLYRSEPAVRRLNLTRLCAMVGTAFELARDRAHADRTKGQGNLASIEAARARSMRSGLQDARAVDAQPPRSSAAEGLGSGPPKVRRASSGGMAAITDILALLGEP